VAGELEEAEDADDGEELEDVGVLEVRGHLSKHQVNVETRNLLLHKKKRNYAIKTRKRY
jgi:hypothetical protein